MKFAELKKQLLARAGRLRRFNEWEAAYPHQLDEAAAIAGIGSLYELIPAALSQTPVQPRRLAHTAPDSFPPERYLMTALERALLELDRTLANNSIPYMIIGSMANAVWGEPRATLVDISV